MTSKGEEKNQCTVKTIRGEVFYGELFQAVVLNKLEQAEKMLVELDDDELQNLFYGCFDLSLLIKTLIKTT